MDHYKNEEFVAMGIPDELIIYVARTNKVKVGLSAKEPDGKGNFRTDDATKVWKRLESRKLATYNEREDFYIHTP